MGLDGLIIFAQNAFEVANSVKNVPSLDGFCLLGLFVGRLRFHHRLLVCIIWLSAVPQPGRYGEVVGIILRSVVPKTWNYAEERLFVLSRCLKNTDRKLALFGCLIS
jgi:hypothetical protein